ncbi:hypothetical protein PHMEG_0006142 [Phytophthora megakarya]|uniref:Uncharacterized protein n=1 Tax=Phytophthora megakarya TaxID=4795 RepID=A0A225WRB1_9STRA|nr:hypothetical protein PHMEG_0006142 [Phytophthora megakarya]
MRQRASTKTQRRLKQQQLRDPYALTDDVYNEAPTFQVGGLVTAVGVLQVVTAMALGGVVFGGALLFCMVLLAVLGLALLHHSDPQGRKQGLGLKQAINRLVALRRSALDYSLTLSIAQSETQKKQLQLAVVPSSPTPQKVVATMTLKQEAAKIKKTMGDGPLVTLNRVDMKPLPTIHSSSDAEELIVEKPRAHSEPKQVLRSRPLLPLKPKKQQLEPVKEKDKTQKTPQVPTKLEKHDKKVDQVQPKPQQQRKVPERKRTNVDKKAVPVLLKTEPKVIVPAVLPKAEPVVEVPKPKPIELTPPAKTIVVEPVNPVVAPLPVFPEQKPLVEVARGEPVMEQELVVTRKVTLYLNPQNQSVVDLEELELEQEDDKEPELEFEHELEDFALSLEAFPPLSPQMAPQALKPPVSDAMEPNFLMDIELEPIAKPEKKLISLNSLRLKPVGDADLRSMLHELDSMRLELDTAMARCSSLLDEEEQVSTPSSPELQPEEEPIFCC